MRVLGMISGTSVDGMDVAVADLQLDGDALVLEPIGARTVPFPADLADAVRTALPPATTTLGAVAALDTRLGQAFAAAAVAALEAYGPVEVVTSHGQTVFHWVEGGRALGTLQLGQPAWIAAATGTPVVSDLRSADIAAGGQGAPLVSLIDVWWLRSRPGRPVALNLGGIANLTAAGGPSAYDVGPANALIDAVVAARTGHPCDAGGALAAEGTVDEEALAVLAEDPWFAAPAPKSTGKEHFHLGYLRDRLGDWVSRVPAPDVVATVTALTVRTVAAAVRAEAATELLISGGGADNPILMSWLADALPGVAVRRSDELGLPADAKEAYAFAVLGWLSWHGLPGTLAACTGARDAAILGSLTPGGGPLRLPPPVPDGPSRLVIRPSVRAEGGGSSRLG